MKKQLESLSICFLKIKKKNKTKKKIVLVCLGHHYIKLTADDSFDVVGWLSPLT